MSRQLAVGDTPDNLASSSTSSPFGRRSVRYMVQNIGSSRSGGLRSRHHVPSNENASATRLAHLSFANSRDADRMVATLIRHPDAAIQITLTELPKVWWSEIDYTTVLDFPTFVWTAETMVEYAQDVTDASRLMPRTTPYQALLNILYPLFRNASDEVFEDGMDSSFSADLNRIVRAHGIVAVDALEKVLDGANVEVAEEALRQIGYMDDEVTHNRRLSLLERALESPNSRVRDAASIGLDAMDDPAAIKSLQRAVDCERYEPLRQNLEIVLRHLQDSR